ncbi:MAG: hypothetical protein FJW81_08160 [Actinobacteria bacterium]|nr:hypothetical protein [Actinomycetota bacterium]
MAKDLPIAKLLAEFGYRTDAAQSAARAVLEDARITRAGKERIAAYKRDDAEAVLRARVALLCPACAEAGLGGDVPDPVTAGTGDRCRVCEGSANRRGALAFAAACWRAGLARVIVVGGSPDIRRELPGLLPDLDLRVVDGTVARPGRDVQRELDGADLVVLLGSTELNHTVSATWASPKTVATQTRGIGAFLLEAAAKVGDRADRTGR